MRIGVSVKMRVGGYDRFGIEKYNKIKSHGFDCVDFDMCKTSHPLYALNEKDFAKHLLAEKALAQKAGIEIYQTHGPWPCPVKTLEDAEAPEKMDILEQSIRGAQLLGCKYWVIHPLMPFGMEDIKMGLENETWEINVSFMKKLACLAGKYDVTVCVENTPFPFYSLARPKQILKLVHAVDDSHLKICLDTGHVAVFSDISVGASVRLLREEIKVFHIHDNHGQSDEHLYPHEGCIDWQDFSSAVREIGFDGVLSLEIVPKETLPTTEFEMESIKLAAIARTLAEEIARS